jgi:hypothetical protein
LDGGLLNEMHIDGAAVLLGFMVVDTEYDECEIAH